MTSFSFPHYLDTLTYSLYISGFHEKNIIPITFVIKLQI